MSPIVKRIQQLLFIVALQAAILFVSAGSLTWAAGWWYTLLYLGMLLLAAMFLLPNRREVIAERSKGAEGAKSWDLWITRMLAVPSLGLLALSGLDERWNLSAPLPLWLRLAGGLMLAVGYAGVVWAMYCNPFFAQVVRIQPERGHVTTTQGPYRFIRHPGYAGMLFSMAGAVFLLDCLWGLIPFALSLGLIIARTALEDRALRDELPGYLEYSQRTRYRLLPGVW